MNVESDLDTHKAKVLSKTLARHTSSSAEALNFRHPPLQAAT